MRGIWRGSISFGLIQIPVQVVTAERDRDIHFRMLDQKNHKPIQYRRVNQETGKEVANDRIVKGYEYEKGKFVIMSDEDFKEANPKASRAIEIEDFVNMRDIDYILFEKPYYLIPQKGGEKGYFLLHEALKKSNKGAIAKMVMHTKQHLSCIFPKGEHLILEWMRFSHRIKDERTLDSLKEDRSHVKFRPQEIKMAEDLIRSMTARWNPQKYDDTYYEDVMKHIEKRVKAGQLEEIEDVRRKPPERVKAPRSEDLMALLKQSLRQREKKKPNHRREERA